MSSSSVILRSRSAMWFWAVACGLLYIVGLVLASVWGPLEPYGDTLMLLALGIACLLNFGRNRTLHCAITGPLFLVGAVAAALIEGGVWTFDLSVIWTVVLIGVAVACAIEWFTVGQHKRTAA